MGKYVGGFLDGFDSFFAWLSASLRQTAEAYCELETADSSTALVAHDGSLITLITIDGVKALVGQDEFTRIHEGITNSLRSPMSRPGHSLQVFFSYDRQRVRKVIADSFEPAKQTAKRIELKLDDLFNERLKHVADYCAEEKVYFVLWTEAQLLVKRANESCN